MSHIENKNFNNDSNTLFDLSKLVCINKVNPHQCFLYHANLGNICLIIDEQEKAKNISKNTMINLFECSREYNVKNIFLLLSKDNKEFTKISQIILLLGFERNYLLKNAVLEKGKCFSIFKMKMNFQNLNDIEDIDI